MEASSFEESNGYLGPPEGMTPDEVFALSVWRGTYPDGTPLVISCWKPTPEELEEIQRTGRVWLGILGHSMPPAWVSGINPFEERGDA